MKDILIKITFSFLFIDFFNLCEIVNCISHCSVPLIVFSNEMTDEI